MISFLWCLLQQNSSKDTSVGGSLCLFFLHLFLWWKMFIMKNQILTRVREWYKKLPYTWEIVFPLNSSVEVLTLRTSECNIFGARGFKEVIKVKWSHLAGSSSIWLVSLYKEEIRTENTDGGETCEEAASRKPRWTAPEEVTSANTLTLDFEPLQL